MTVIPLRPPSGWLPRLAASVQLQYGKKRSATSRDAARDVLPAPSAKRLKTAASAGTATSGLPLFTSTSAQPPPTARTLSSKSSNLQPKRSKTLTSATKSTSKSNQPAALSQLHLNFSTSASASTMHCAQCGMSYARAEIDMALHAQHHKRFTAGLQYALGSCKDEVVLQQYVRSGVGKLSTEGSLVVLPASARKAKEVIALMEAELSACPLTATELSTSKLYIFVTSPTKTSSTGSRGQVVAAVLAGRISQAHLVLEEESAEAIRVGDDGPSSALYASSKSSPALLGIHRMWCAPTHRRRRLTSTLLNAVSSHFIYGQPLTTPAERMQWMAWSQPTESGAKTASAWLGVCQRGGWKVYE